MYEMSKDGFSFLVFKFNGKEAGEYKEKFIAAFNAVVKLAVIQDVNLNDYDFIMNRALELSQIRMKNLESKVNQQAEQLQLSEKTIKESAPKIKYHDEVLQTKNGHPITLIAAELGISAVKLNRILVKNGVIRKVGGTYVLCEKYLNRGYTTSYTHKHLALDGVTEISEILMTWTELGRKWIIEEYKKLIAVNSKF
jgi:phage antirepressor YoqD-like protein